MYICPNLQSNFYELIFFHEFTDNYEKNKHDCVAYLDKKAYI